MLGLDPDAADGALTLTASLPEWLGSIEMTRLRAGDGSADFRIAATPPGVMTLEVRGASGADLKLTGGPGARCDAFRDRRNADLNRWCR
jgi:hypothetical protein